jgi:hypothetical protein
MIKSSFLITCRTLLILSLFFSLISSNLATNYYFHPIIGHDDNEGTSSIDPLKSLNTIQNLILLPGDSILLAAGYQFEGTIMFRELSGTKDKPIVITSYDWESCPFQRRATINAKGFLNGIELINCSHIKVDNVEIIADGGCHEKNGQMRCGVLVVTTKTGQFENITLHNLSIHNIFYENYGFVRGEKEVRTANGTQAYGWGIRFIIREPSSILKDLTITNNSISNVSHTGIKFTGNNGQNIQNIKVSHNQVSSTGGPGIQMSGVHSGHFHNNSIDSSGSNNDSRKWGRGSGLWTWGSSDIIIENNRFTNANGPGDSAGCHIDYNCKNIIVQYNFSAHNAGGFCEILGNNYNCAYRYNISVNDGHRIKGENGAFQEGKTLWLSGYAGNENRNGPYNSYFYNNTIYMKESLVSKSAIDRMANGILIVNNIFYIEGLSEVVKGDQYNPETEGEWEVKDIIFTNNLFLKPTSWPASQKLQDENPLFGDPDFYQKGGLEFISYIPKNINIIKNKGVKITQLPKDTIGITIGLHPNVDILGNPIIALPDIGAIELK